MLHMIQLTDMPGTQVSAFPFDHLILSKITKEKDTNPILCDDGTGRNRPFGLTRLS